jgi:hypothetical protein
MRTTIASLIFAFAATLSFAQVAAVPSTPTRDSLPGNIYAFGLTYNPNASPVVAGTGLYGRLVDNKGTYAVAVLDVVPTTAQPYTITTNPSAGVAQEFYAHANLKVFVTPSAGLSYSGTNTGYSYAMGGLITYDLSPSYALGFGGRLFKSNISGSGYQPAISFEFILKQ